MPPCLCRYAVYVALALLSTASGAAENTASARVRFSSGVVVGAVSNDVAAYKGIPYARPPVGRLRWRAPEDPARWLGERRAEDYGFSCPQTQTPRPLASGSRANQVNEDCLTLNVWTPVNRQGLLPVMVWIHGGGNQQGTSAQTYYDGSAFARDGVVLVSLNYRLGILGFFAHPSLTQEAHGHPQTNFALLDQLHALKWVRRNVAAFGGDPAKVTVFGESAGGQDILTLMTIRAARGLFTKAIVESAGVAAASPTLQEAERQGTHAAQSLGLSGAQATTAALRAIPAATLIKEAQLDVSPIVDGALLERAPLATFTAGRALSVPLVIGTNSGEATEPFFTAPAQLVAAHQPAAYLYRFDYVLSLLRARRPTAPHGSEIPFVFQTFTTSLLSETDEQVEHLLHGCWIIFAQTGQPVCPGAPAWPAFASGEHRWMVLGAPPRVEIVPDLPHLQPVREPPTVP